MSSFVHVVEPFAVSSNVAADMVKEKDLGVHSFLFLVQNDNPFNGMKTIQFSKYANAESDALNLKISAR